MAALWSALQQILRLSPTRILVLAQLKIASHSPGIDGFAFHGE